jgi:flagellar motor switch protein FliM
MQQSDLAAAGPQATARALAEGQKLAPGRLPVLQGVFEKMATHAAAGLRALCEAPCQILLEDVRAGSLWELLQPFEGGIAAVCNVSGWDKGIIIGCDRSFAFALVEAMFGGDGTESPYAGNRPLSPVECQSMQEAMTIVTAALQVSFSPIGKPAFAVERFEPALEIAALEIADAPALLAELKLQVFDGGGRLFVAMPQAALAPMRKRLERDPPLEPANQDPNWARQMQSQVENAHVALLCTIEGPDISLDAVCDLHIGQVLGLDATPSSLFTLENEGKALFRCKLGQSKGMFTVRIEAEAGESADLLSEIATGTGPA